MEPSAANLNTNDVFVLKSPNSMFLWRGIGATDEELAAAKYVCSFLGGSATDVAEGKEPGDHLPDITNAFKISLREYFYLQLRCMDWLIKSACLKVPLVF